MTGLSSQQLEWIPTVMWKKLSVLGEGSILWCTPWGFCQVRAGHPLITGLVVWSPPTPVEVSVCKTPNCSQWLASTLHGDWANERQEPCKALWIKVLHKCSHLHTEHRSTVERSVMLQEWFGYRFCCDSGSGIHCNCNCESRLTTAAVLCRLQSL